MKQKIVLLLLLVFGSFKTLLAQDVSKDTTLLDEVVVTGSKIETRKKQVPFSVSQINRRQIENSGSLNILPLLNNFVPGVFVTERNILGFGVATGGSGGISIRGIGGAPNTGVLVLIDGHPQYQGIFGHPFPDAYVASDVQKVEIIRGPASMLYGTNAMGGVVNIITRKNEKQGAHGSLGASYGSYNTQKYYGTIGYKEKKLDVFASVNHDKTDGTRDSTDFKITNGYTKLGYQINDNWSVMADLMLAKFNANDNGPVFKPALFNIDILRGKTSVALFNKLTQLEGAFKFYHNFGDHVLSDGFKSTDRNSGLVFYQTLRPFKGNTLTIGTDFSQYGGKANMGKAKDSLKTLTEVAGYVYTQQMLVDMITLSGGLRWDHSNLWGTQWVPTAGLAISPVAATTFKASVSKGFRSPTVMEMYLYAPNPDLKPEKMINYEIAWLQNLISNKLKLELTGYTIHGDNLIQVVGSGPTAKRQNVGKFDNKGIEVALNYIPLAGLHLHSNYSYLHQKTITLAAPRHQFNVNVNYQYHIWNFFVGLQRIEKLYSSISPKKINSYTLLNARVSAVPFKNLSFFITGNNLLNKEYEINYGYPMPKANFSVGAGFQF